MRRSLDLILWTVAAAIGLGLLAWGFPRAFPFFPAASWETSRTEAEAIALERLRDLGPPVANPYVVSRLTIEDLVERRLELESAHRDVATLAASGLARHVAAWEVTVYAPGAYRGEWTYQARVGLDGTVRSLQLRIPPDRGADVEPLDAARLRADGFLRDQGLDPAKYEAPVPRTQQLATRTDLALRYRSRERIAGDAVAYGVEVDFAGRQLTGFQPWMDDPGRDGMRKDLQASQLFSQTRIMGLFVLLPFVAVFFVRRYHEGEIGVRRGAQILLLVFAAGATLLVLAARAATQDFQFGTLTRQQTTWAWGGQMLFLFFLPTALIAMLSWSVGEALCRERWGRKLAAFDALLQRDWSNATVARSALRGVSAGLLLAGAGMAVMLPLRALGVWTPMALFLGPWWESARWPGLALVAFALALGIYGELFGRLFIVPLLVRRLGPALGGLAAVAVSLAVLWLPANTLPFAPSLAIGAVFFGVLVFLFLRYDLLTTLLAAVVANVAGAAWPFLAAQDPSVQVQGAIALAAVMLPLVVTLPYLLSEREFEYRYEDVPPHVRRIAERERQRVELETARNIQSSILPQLPPQLAGVELAHAYLPASEVGGDFYDVLALEDGRLAVAVGDVAGHGVSSGLVMSMAKSALAVQVTFDPAVESVFATLNRMVFQSARKRLLATLCYALLDPRRRELFYASAGHLYPYRVTTAGSVEPLEATEEYPLGVRPTLEVHTRASRLDAGDTLVLYSDGVVEARRDGGDEIFGFHRLEESLRRHAGRSPQQIRDGVLGDVTRFTGGGPREDDVTLLVLRLPAA